jgi:hypothetical protein
MTEFSIKYNLHKDGTPVVDTFKTENEREEAILLKKKEGYHPIRISSDNESICKHLQHKF